MRIFLAALLTLSAAPAYGGNVDFTLRQLDWVTHVGPDYPYSRVGEADFKLTAANTEFLASNGGAYINITLFNNVSGGIAWPVRNLYLSYPNLTALLADSPTVRFGLGDDSAMGTPWGLTYLAVETSSAPLTAYTLSNIHTQVPPTRQVLSGGGGPVSPGGGWDVLPLLLGPYIGSFSLPTSTGSIQVPVDKIPKINEGPMECAPASVARSIAYLEGLAGLPPGTPQADKDLLAILMGTDPGTGTQDGDMLDGKNTFVDFYELPICSEIKKVTDRNWDELVCDIIGMLNDGYDIEVLLDWPGGGHAAMLTSLTKHDDGSVTIEYVDDPNQKDDKAENETHIETYPPGGANLFCSIDGFFCECWSMEMCGPDVTKTDRR